MSLETVDSATPALEAPSTVESAIEASIADHPDRVVDDPEAGLSPASDSPGLPQEPTAASAAVQAEIDELAKALGLGDKPSTNKADWFKTRLPYSKVKQVVAAREKAAKEAHEASLKEHTTKVSDYEARFNQIEQLERMMENDPEAFMQRLAAHYPSYARFMATGGAEAPTGAYGSPNGASGQPQPDIQLTDGRYSYSPEAAAALAEWKANQVIEKRLAPIEQERQAQQIYASALPKVQAQIKAAEGWPLFKENQDGILAALKADRSLSLTEAYQQIVLPKLATNRDSIRAEVLAELKQKPHSTSVTSSSVVKDEPILTNTEAVIRAALKR